LDYLWVTVRVSVVLRVRLPDLPVIVTDVVVMLVEPFVENVTVLEVVVGFEENTAVTPFGSPEADRATLLLKPPAGLTVIVLETLPPCFTDTLPGAAAIEKSGASTTSETAAFALL
jgi:hypothetical protein